MSCYHDFPCLVFLIELLVFFYFFLLKLVTVVLLIVHIDSSVLKFFDRDIILYKPITVILEINDIVYGYVQEPYHNVEALLIDLHDVENPDQKHQNGV
jgi:hypothetical protein